MDCFARIAARSGIPADKQKQKVEKMFYVIKKDKLMLIKAAITNPSTQGSGRKVFRSIPMTLVIVLIAETPSHPDLRATLAGCMQQKQNIFIKKLICHIVPPTLFTPRTSAKLCHVLSIGLPEEIDAYQHYVSLSISK